MSQRFIAKWWRAADLIVTQERHHLSGDNKKTYRKMVTLVTLVTTKIKKTRGVTRCTGRHEQRNSTPRPLATPAMAAYDGCSSPLIRQPEPQRQPPRMPPQAPSRPWPDAVDAATTFGMLGLALAIVVLGYVFMVLDFRAYLRSLRRALVRVVQYLPDFPAWARGETPRCLAVLGLRMPCTDEDLKRAYRQKVKMLHPDRGGDRRRFLRLQSQFEEALRWLADNQGVGRR